MVDKSTLIPPRWLHCPRKGQAIAGKFVPFKTPLSSRYDNQVPEECRFDVDMFFLSTKARKLRVGLVVDLTNTTRFYDKKDVEKEDCKYLKLQCRGHGETPSEEQTQTFIQVCHHFIRQKPLEVVGIHCTHGFNRSGFLIVSYLVEKMDWSVDAAVSAFAQARPPGIYKGDYLVELFKRYGDKDDTPPPPPLPDWCTESDDRDDDGNPVFATPNEGRREGRREFNKKNATFMDGLVPSVKAVTSQPRLSQIQRTVQEMCGWKSRGFPGAQPVSMDMQNLDFMSQKPYKVSWKADGVRYMMLILGKDEVYTVDRDNAVFHVPNLVFPKRKDLNDHLSNTLLDGEMIVDMVEGNPVPRFLVYDIIKFESIAVGGTVFSRRLLCIEKEIVGPRQDKFVKGLLDKTQEPFSVRPKNFWDIFNAKHLLEKKFSAELCHETDGLIFQPASEAYKCGRCDEVLKWKPPSLNSVDFKLKIIRERKEGQLPETKGYLYVGGYDQPVSEMKVSKEMKELDSKIIECCWDFETKRWKFMRQRTDKSFPNAKATAEAVWNSIQNPVTEEKLLSFIEDHGVRPKPGPPPPPALKRPAPKNPTGDHVLMPPPNKVPRM